MKKKTEIDSYSKLYYWIECMLNSSSRTIKQRAGLKKLRDFVQDKESQGWKWEDVAEWAIYATATSTGFDPHEEA